MSAVRRIVRPRTRIRAIQARHHAAHRAAHARGFYRQFMVPGSLCFDIGANIGDRTQMFLDIGCRVVAAEPQPQCVAKLERLRQPRLTIEQVAVGAETGTAEMHLAEIDTMSTIASDWLDRVRESHKYGEMGWPTTIEVNITTLDKLIERHGIPDFCKIDVEGYEPLVFAGLTQPIPALSFEYTPEYADAAIACVQRLHDLGSRWFNYSEGETLTLNPDNWQTSSSIIELLKTIAVSPHASRTFGDVYALTVPLAHHQQHLAKHRRPIP